MPLAHAALLRNCRGLDPAATGELRDGGGLAHARMTGGADIAPRRAL